MELRFENEQANKDVPRLKVSLIIETILIILVLFEDLRQDDCFHGVHGRLSVN